MPDDAIKTLIESHRWWHTIQITPDLVTPGSWDLRQMADRIPWPSSLQGGRCLDIGTMDGFWAFEMERRGAREVVAIDIPRQQMDAPWDLQGSLKSASEPRGTTFKLAADLLHSRGRYQELSVYDLDPGTLGTFDLVFTGYVLALLRDPIGALQAVRRVCKGHIIVLDVISLYPSLIHRAPLARIAARRGVLEWFVFNTAGLKRCLELAGFEVERTAAICVFSQGLQSNHPTCRWDCGCGAVWG
jgi:tRNA (mo5U34)-methyltransferase